MKTEITNTRSDNTLENLDEQAREWILEIAVHASLADVAINCAKRGIKTSRSSLSRFIRRDREMKLLQEREESKATVDELAEGAKEGKLREGTLEAVRQRLYERALVSQSPEEARELYAALVKEEAKLRELELEARRVAIAEEGLKLQALVARSKLAGKVKGEVVASAPVLERGAENAGVSEVKQLQGPTENEKRLWEAVTQAAAILNRGGPLEDRLLEARSVLAEAVKCLPHA